MLPLEISEAKKLPQSIPVILVPFREQLIQKRGEQLKKFTSHMKRWHPDWPILIIEQYGDQKFNRGALLNIGTRYAQKMGATYVVYHDVDLIPLAPIVPYYTAFPEKPIHIGGIYKGKYQGDSFIGQVLSISLSDIKKINGFPNMFWGWGGEDDALMVRLIKNNIKKVYYPKKGSIIDTEEINFKQINILTKLKMTDQDQSKFEKLYYDMNNYKKNGLSNLEYKILERKNIDTNIINIKVDLLKKNDVKKNPQLYNRLNNYEEAKKLFSLVVQERNKLSIEYI